MLTLDTLLQPDHSAALFACVAGSHAYGTATAESDRDLRGIVAMPAGAYLDWRAPPAQIADARNDMVFFSLRRAIELLAEANPGVLELLFMPTDCVLRSSPEMDALVAQRQLFITRRSVTAHLGYATTQIKKARGQHKWVNNPKPEAAPRREAFCHVIPREDAATAGSAPARPLPLERAGVSLAECRAAKVEHATGVYRLYRGNGSAGVFRGDEVQCQSIPIEQEAGDFIGLLLYNEMGWRRASTEHAQHWTWRRERNEARWRQQERGELDYDAKNLMHTVRVLMSGESLLRRREPLVRIEGDALQCLRDIRSGHFSYEQILDIADGISGRCQQLLDHSDLPAETDPAVAAQLLQELTAHWEARCR